MQFHNYISLLPIYINIYLKGREIHFWYLKTIWIHACFVSQIEVREVNHLSGFSSGPLIFWCLHLGHPAGLGDFVLWTGGYYRNSQQMLLCALLTLQVGCGWWVSTLYHVLTSNWSHAGVPPVAKELGEQRTDSWKQQQISMENLMK